jgi:hypothetical protein
MSALETNEIAEVLSRVKTWSQPSRITLARCILETLETPAVEPSRRGRPVHELIGLGAGGSPPPDDDQVRKWLDEHRTEKYG